MWYIVYKAYARARNGETYKRTYVKKLRRLIGKRILGRPKIIDFVYDPETDHYLVSIKWRERQAYRGGIKHPREHEFSITLAQGKNHRITNLHLTRHPPAGPKIDRR